MIWKGGSWSNRGSLLDTFPGLSGQRDPAFAVDTIMSQQEAQSPKVLCDPKRDDAAKSFLPQLVGFCGLLGLAPCTALYACAPDCHIRVTPKILC